MRQIRVQQYSIQGLKRDGTAATEDQLRKIKEAFRPVSELIHDLKLQGVVIEVTEKMENMELVKI